MPTPTYTPLANITLGSSASSVTFSSISQAYRDLVLVMQVKTSAVCNVYLRPNNDTTTANYSYVNMGGFGSGSGSSGSNSGGYSGAILTAYSTPDATTWWDNKTDLMDYSATDKHKTLLTRNGDAAEAVVAIASRWASTSAMTSLVITTGDSNTFSAGSTFALYGIAA